MATALTLAATTAHHGGSIPSPLTIVLVVAAVGYVLWSRMQGRPLKLRRLIVLPIILVVLGITDLTGSSAPHLTSKDIGFLAVGIVLSIVLGAARGATIEIYSNQGELWQRYRRSTVGLWVALIAAKIVLLAIAKSAHASAGGGTNSLLLALGVSLLAEAAIVGPRATSTGLPFATGRSRPDGRQPGVGSGRGPIHRLLGEAATQPRPTGDPYRRTVRSAAPAHNQPGRNDQPRRDDQTQWGPQQTPAGYRADRDYQPDSYGPGGYRSDRRRSRRGPIHRLLGADGSRRRDR